MVLQKILCRDIAGNCIEAIDKKSVQEFIKRLKDEIGKSTNYKSLGDCVWFDSDIVDELAGDAVQEEGDCHYDDKVNI